LFLIIILIIALLVVAGGRDPNEKPTTVASRGFLSKSLLQIRQAPAAAPVTATTSSLTCRTFPIMGQTFRPVRAPGQARSICSLIFKLAFL